MSAKTKTILSIVAVAVGAALAAFLPEAQVALCGGAGATSVVAVPATAGAPPK